MEKHKITLAHIPNPASYDGYLWWSNADKPLVYKNESLPVWPEEGSNPFIIEGQLFDKQTRKSFSIRFIDGSYCIHCADLNEFKSIEYIEKEYLPNRMEGISKLCFREYWRPEEDDLCEGMEVLKPAELIFVGFKNREE